MIDLHSHLVPGVDDGAVDLAQSRAALETLREQGVEALVTTPHLLGSVTLRPDRMEEVFGMLDPAWESLRALAARDLPGLRVERGVEVMLDTPAPDLSDERVRLAGTPFALVEFPYLRVPPNSAPAIGSLAARGWFPVIAHPERYRGVDAALEVVEDWIAAGGVLQVNDASLLGGYGSAAEGLAWRLLEHGAASYLGSDYHARGRCAVAEARRALEERGGAEQAALLMEENPRRLLEGLPPLPVPPLAEHAPPLWRRVLGALRR